MKDYLSFGFSADECRSQLDALKKLLEYDSLSERNDLLPFFKDNHHLSALIGTLFSYIGKPDRLAFEYDLFGDFVCDIAVGDTISQQYGLIELEDATENSIFQRHQRATSY